VVSLPEICLPAYLGFKTLRTDHRWLTRSVAKRRNFASKRLSLCRMAFDDVLLKSAISSLLVPFSLNSIKRSNSAFVSNPFVTLRCIKWRNSAWRMILGPRVHQELLRCCD
jgi:hypothetical protein